ncbi:formylglycine-generating enzyme required for sulfatase activity [Parabacteroides sp. PM5-20]|uniref:SUMF1/EgtB/PvdO family nonheme iron enzyme n=1 Tax=Parabacteroides sp. PM5-20 TaxID=2940527 RepID=UPI002475438A|nr:SUMF1/EgtB/PvdO family nonheme iron enzyme [Parabacteroides sp. PM5-20]MDH6535216.1 formylglycine-generating enzyme required for sulfatase activity [Parabacteroides sp. PM5-20]
MRKRIFTVMAALCGLVAVNAADVNVLAGENLATKISDAAGSGIVRVQVGTYVLPAELIIPTGVTVKGGYDVTFDEKTRVYPGAASSAAEMTILDGDAAHRVASVAGTLEGVVVRNGHVRTGNGGGVSVTGTVQNCIIKGNVAMTVGTGAESLGGGVYLDGADAKLINSVVAFNMANNGYGVAGEGQVINNTITANTYAPVAVAIAGNVGGSPFTHYKHWVDANNAWSTANGFDAQELYFDGFSIAQTQTTTSQYAVFAAAMDLKVDGTGVLFVDAAKGTDKLFQVDGTYGLHLSGMDYIYKVGNANWPMSYVSWYGAKAYCEWIGGALPTEGQWEYAARMNEDKTINTMVYAGSEDAKEVACYAGYPGGMQEVATKMNNGIGLYDMSGNVWEWCFDLYDATGGNYPDYTLAAVSDSQSLTNPVNDKKGSNRVLRGGSYANAGGNLSLAVRHNTAPTRVSNGMGFRPVLIP